MDQTFQQYLHDKTSPEERHFYLLWANIYNAENNILFENGISFKVNDINKSLTDFTKDINIGKNLSSEYAYLIIREQTVAILNSISLDREPKKNQQHTDDFGQVFNISLIKDTPAYNKALKKHKDSVIYKTRLFFSDAMNYYNLNEKEMTYLFGDYNDIQCDIFIQFRVFYDIIAEYAEAKRGDI